MQKLKRNSSIELLKIFAIIIIVFSHAIPTPQGEADIPYYFMDLTLNTNSIQRLVIVGIKYLGQLGNALFVICSSFFLLDSKKCNIKKVMYIIADTFIVSVIFLGIFVILGYDFSIKTIVKQFFPILFNNNWFIGCYLLFYAIHPALNIILENIEQRVLLSADIVLMVIYCGINVLNPNSYYYNQLIGFICIYCIVAYLKRYMINITSSEKVNIYLLLLGLVGVIGLIVVTNYVGLQMGMFKNQLMRWSVFVNPFILCIAFALFNWAKKSYFTNEFVNYISTSTLLIYIIHDNTLFKNYLRSDIFKYIYDNYTYQYELIWVGLYGVILSIVAILLAILYKETIQKIVKVICDKIFIPIEKIYNISIDLLMKIK